MIGRPWIFVLTWLTVPNLCGTVSYVDYHGHPKTTLFLLHPRLATADPALR